MIRMREKRVNRWEQIPVDFNIPFNFYFYFYLLISGDVKFKSNISIVWTHLELPRKLETY